MSYRRDADRDQSRGQGYGGQSYSGQSNYSGSGYHNRGSYRQAPYQPYNPGSGSGTGSQGGSWNAPDSYSDQRHWDIDHESGLWFYLDDAPEWFVNKLAENPTTAYVRWLRDQNEALRSLSKGGKSDKGADPKAVPQDKGKSQGGDNNPYPVVPGGYSGPKGASQPAAPGKGGPAGDGPGKGPAGPVVGDPITSKGQYIPPVALPGSPSGIQQGLSPAPSAQGTPTGGGMPFVTAIITPGVKPEPKAPIPGPKHVPNLGRGGGARPAPVPPMVLPPPGMGKGQQYGPQQKRPKVEKGKDVKGLKPRGGKGAQLQQQLHDIQANVESEMGVHPGGFEYAPSGSPRSVASGTISDVSYYSGTPRFISEQTGRSERKMKDLLNQAIKKNILPVPPGRHVLFPTSQFEGKGYVPYGPYQDAYVQAVQREENSAFAYLMATHVAYEAISLDVREKGGDPITEHLLKNVPAVLNIYKKFFELHMSDASANIGGRLGNKSDYAYYRKCLQFLKIKAEEEHDMIPESAFKELLLSTDYNDMSIRKRRQKALKLIKGQEGGKWLVDNHFFQLWETLVDEGWDKFVASLQASRDADVPTELQDYHAAYQGEQMLNDSDDDGTQDPSQEYVRKTARVTAPAPEPFPINTEEIETIGDFLRPLLFPEEMREKNEDGDSDAGGGAVPDGRDLVDIESVVSQGDDESDLEFSFRKQCAESISCIQYVEENPNPDGRTHKLIGGPADDPDEYRGRLVNSATKVLFPEMEKTDRIDPSKLLKKLRLEEGEKVTPPEAEPQNFLFGDLVHRAAHSQNIKSKWVHPSEMFTTIANSPIFQPEVITVPGDETFGPGNPGQPPADQLNRPGEPWVNFPAGTKAIQFLDEAFFKSVDREKLQQLIQSHNWYRENDVKYPTVVYPNIRGDELGTPSFSNAELTSTDVQWGDFDFVSMFRIDTKPDIVAQLLQGAEEFPVLNGQGQSVTAPVFKGTDSLAADSHLQRSMMAYSDPLIALWGLQGSYVSRQNNGLEGVVISVFASGYIYKRVPKKADGKAGSKKIKMSQKARFASKRPVTLRIGLIFIDTPLALHNLHKQIPSLTIDMPDSLKFALATSMRNTNWASPFLTACGACTQSVHDKMRDLFVNFAHMALKSRKNLENFNPRNILPGNEFNEDVTFLKKHEKLLLEGIMWMYASAPDKNGTKGVSRYYEALIDMLWKMFPQHSEFHQRWRQFLFISATSLECQYTVSGYVTDETRVIWSNIERFQNDSYPGVAADYQNIAVEHPVPQGFH